MQNLIIIHFYDIRSKQMFHNPIQDVYLTEYFDKLFAVKVVDSFDDTWQQQLHQQVHIPLVALWNQYMWGYL